jgi:hypothetical protein
MKRLTLWGTGLGIIVLGCATLYALTEEWRYPVDGTIFQVMSDGKGGCAIAVLVTDVIHRVEWIDSQGLLQFDSGEMGSTLPYGLYTGPVHECTRRQLVFTSSYFLPVLIQVTRKGTVIPAFALDGFIIGAPINPMISIAFPRNRFADKKGFFVINVNTNTDENTLVRYTYK